jgi:hypothetical protein
MPRVFADPKAAFFSEAFTHFPLVKSSPYPNMKNISVSALTKANLC